MLEKMSNNAQHDAEAHDGLRPRKTSKGRAAGPNRKVRVSVRLWDWSLWCRQVVRGVQRFGHEQRGWEIVADIGPVSSVTTAQRSAGSPHIPVDGAIVGVLNEVAAFRRLLKAGHPKLVAVSANIPKELSAITSVRVDEAKVAVAIGQHLLSGGFRRLAYCAAGGAGGRDHRAEAILAFAEAHGCPCDVFHGGSVEPAMILAGIKNWVKRLQKPVGVVCWNMNVARYTVTACQRAGIPVPEQAAVVGWDDDVVLAESSQPSITAAVMPAERLGYEAARLLNELLLGHAPPTAPLLLDPPPALLHVRQSSDVSTLRDRDVWLALQYIREHGTEGLKVSHLSKALQISRRKLEQQFKRVTGNTLHHAIVSVRVEQAKQLLLETDWTLDRVASRAGLATRQTLHNVFLRREQMTPAVYRQRFGAAR
jgi:LacI family transcriptional regulator